MSEPELYLKPILEALMRDPQELPSIQLYDLHEKAQILKGSTIKSIGDVRGLLEQDRDQLARFEKLKLTIGLLGQLLEGVLYIDEACEAELKMGRPLAFFVPL